LFAQQMAAQAQLQEMRRRALPGGPGPQVPGIPGLAGPQQPGQTGQGTGQYL
jgi:hypothetical protein